MTVRLIVVTLCMLGAMILGSRAMKPELVPLREPLQNLGFDLGEWRGQDAQPFDDKIVAILGVDEYVSRWYQASDRVPISLYVGYYQSQRQGDTIHSPMNCLPGAGWQPMETGRQQIIVPGRHEPIEVNRVVIQKGLDRQLALYWYQSHGRVVASEYWSKIFMVYDAVRLNRSDAALVRVISPIEPSEPNPDATIRRSLEFVKVLMPALERHLPS